MSADRKRAAIYGRQSHGRQASVDDQVREAMQVCGREGWTETIYTDKVSASRFGTKERGGWSELTVDVTAGKIDVVIVWDSTRADRTPETWSWFLERCRRREVSIYSVRDGREYDPRNPGDWRRLHEDGVQAGYESEIKSADVKRGVAGAALAGRPHGRSAYGLTRRYDAHDRRKFTEEPDEHADTVREIVRRVALEDPIKAITDSLNERGIASPFGGVWSRRVVRRLATNPAYIGKRSHNGVLHDATWPALVDEPTFLRAQEVLAAPDRQRSAPGSKRHLLSYLAVASCGSQLQAWSVRDGRRPAYRCHGDGCIGVDMMALDAYVTELVCARLAREDARKVFAVDDALAAHARAAVQRVRHELDDLTTQLSAGTISATLAGQAEVGVRRRLDEAERELQRHTRHGALAALLDADDVYAAWDGLSVPAKRSVLEMLFARIEVGPAAGRLSRWSSDEDRLRLAIERTTVEWA